MKSFIEICSTVFLRKAKKYGLTDDIGFVFLDA